MLTDPSLVENARTLLQQEWRGGAEASTAAASVCECPTLWLLPQLVDMISESCDRPVAQLAPTIKRLIVEHTFHGLSGDYPVNIAFAEAGTRSIERQVRTMVRVLELVRRSALAKGQWSDTPVTPQMFG